MPHQTPREWRKDGFLISTDRALIDLDAVNAAFAADFTPWAVPLPIETLKASINSSLCFGLYRLNATGESDSATGNPTRKPPRNNPHEK